MQEDDESMMTSKAKRKFDFEFEVRYYVVTV